MISKTAIEEYLKRNLDDHLWIKNTTKAEIDAAIALLEVRVPAKQELFLHQKTSFYLGACLNEFLFFLDMGLGKTRISLALIEYWRKQDKIERALVVVPNVINIEGWREEIEAYTPLVCSLLYGTKQDRAIAFEQEADIYIINYDGLQTLMADLVSVKGKKKRERQIIKSKAWKFAEKFDLVIFDEIHRAKNHRSLTFKLCDFLAVSCKYRYGLTGTPFGRDPQDLWSQFYLIDRGETLGKTISMYRAAFFSQHVNHWGGYDYKFDKRKESKLHQMLRHKSIRYEDTECQDLPLAFHTLVPIKLMPDALAIYRDLSSESCNYDGDSTQKKENYYSKMRQVASGFIYTKDEITTIRETITFSHTEKLDAIEEIVEDMPSTSKLIIFHIFNESGKLIGNFLKKKKIPFVAINSESEETAIEQYKKFKKKGAKYRIIVANILSGGQGLNLQNCNYVIYYEPTDRPILYRQSLKRVHRTGQTKQVYYYHLITKGTIEEKIREYLLEGKRLFDALIEGTETFKNFK